MQDILKCFGLENLTNKGILWREYCLFCGYFCGKQHPNFHVKAKHPRVYFYNCHIVKLSLLSLKLSFRSLLQGKQTSKWQFYTTWQFKIKGVNYRKYSISLLDDWCWGRWSMFLTLGVSWPPFHCKQKEYPVSHSDCYGWLTLRIVIQLLAYK